MNLGENIYRYRTANKLSQGDLADSLSVSRQSVSKWENNSAQPELDKLIKMSNLFQLSLDELLFGNAPPANASTPTQRKRPQHTTLEYVPWSESVCWFPVLPCFSRSSLALSI